MMTRIVLVVCCLISISHSAENDSFLKKVGESKEPLSFLVLLEKMGLIEHPLWEEAGKIVKNSSANLGVKSVSLKLGKKSIYQQVVLMGDSSENVPNLKITDIYLKYKKDAKVVEYKFDRNKASYKKKNAQPKPR